MRYSRKPQIDLIAVTRGLEDNNLGPEEISAIGAFGCFEKKSSLDIWEEMKKLPEEKRKSKVRTVLKESAGRGHGSVADQNYFIYSMEDLPRVATLFLCGPEYLSHEQQSLRRATAERGFYLPEEIENSPLFKKTVRTLMNSFDFYQKAVEKGVPKEDARNILPLYTRTNIQTGGDARELMHIRKMAQEKAIPSVVNYTVEKMVKEAECVAPAIFEDTGYNYEVLAWRPSSQLFAETNMTIKNLIEKNNFSESLALLSYSAIDMDSEQIDDAVKNRNEAELANLKHVHFEFLVPMSLSCFHQATRQRTWNQSVESLYDAAKRRQFIVPPKIKNSDLLDDYIHQNECMSDLYEELSQSIPPEEAIGVLPHSLQVYDLIHVDGWNAIHSIGKRTCTEAQWEIRDIAKEMSRHIKEKFPALGKYAEPQCITYGKCPERKPCGYIESHSIE